MTKKDTTDIRVPKSRAERQAELSGLSAEERQAKSEASQARVHKQFSDSGLRAAKLVAASKARRLRAREGGGEKEEDG